MSYDPQRPQEPLNPRDPANPEYPPQPPARSGVPMWVWAAVAVVAVVLLVAFFSGGDMPDATGPVDDAAVPAQSDPMAPAPGTEPAAPTDPAPIAE